ncbi:hypothetical protein BESB_049590 [Besnoitia besnoiti]|uniref:non-specific serine/threonine protein kinase n=1 Tax=Besnoitia besnoiti TaxID=94643 RepID=A0A2A9MM21_BESBE|nr:hypothetical protein BESB_049590 [Besnoitia besnoiti]PFH36767.1 hypothetical protein BESB_049590 [Besnoitia besnoiti]
MDRYKRVKRLGAGAQGDCYLVRDRKTGELCVSKDIKLSLISPEQRQNALNETTILHDVSDHPNIIRYISSHLNAKKQVLHMLIEYADGGDLEQQIQLRRSLLDEHLGTCSLENSSSSSGAKYADLRRYASVFFREEHVLLVFIQALAGLHHLHSRDILHRDIKSQNIFLSSDGLIKLGDFGIARQLDKEQMASTYVGSPCYMSPELYKREAYNSKSDIWALGCVLFELCCLRKPFQGSNIVVLAMQITQNQPPAHLDAPSGLYPAELHRLVNRMLQVAPEERPSTAEIVATPYILRAVKKLLKRYPQLHYLQPYLASSVTTAISPPLAGPSTPTIKPAVKGGESEILLTKEACLERLDSSLDPLASPTLDALFECSLTDCAPQAHAVISILRKRRDQLATDGQRGGIADRPTRLLNDPEPGEGSPLSMQQQLRIVWKCLSSTFPDYLSSCAQPPRAVNSLEGDEEFCSTGGNGNARRGDWTTSHSTASRKAESASVGVTFANPHESRDETGPTCFPEINPEDDAAPATIPWRKLSCTPDDAAACSGGSSFDDDPAEWTGSKWSSSNAQAAVFGNPFAPNPAARAGDKSELLHNTSASPREHHAITRELLHVLKNVRMRTKNHKLGARRKTPQPHSQPEAAESSEPCSGTRGGAGSSSPHSQPPPEEENDGGRPPLPSRGIGTTEELQLEPGNRTKPELEFTADRPASVPKDQQGPDYNAKEVDTESENLDTTDGEEQARRLSGIQLEALLQELLVRDT